MLIPLPIPSPLPIPIPIGEEVHVPAQGTIWKVVSCEQCQQQYAYLIEMEAIGKDLNLLFLDTEGSTQRAAAQAERTLVEMSRNIVLPVPCPHCGLYQADMVCRLKENGSGNGLVIAGLAVTALSLIPLTLSIPNIWILTAVGASVGVGMMGYADLAASLFDPNAKDPETRKALGQKHALCGEQLAKLLAMKSDAEG